MKNILFTLFLIPVLLIQPAEAYAQTIYSIDQEKSRLEYSFRSTLHPVKGDVLEFSGQLSMDEPDGIQLKSGRVVVAASSLDSNNKKRDEKTDEMLDVAAYPQLIFTVESFSQLEQNSELERAGKLKGKLAIKDITREIELKVKIFKSGDQIHLTGSGEISLKAFDLKPPSVLGVIRVFDPVTVNFDVLLKRDLV